MSDAKIRILIADDHVVVRRGVREIIREHLPGAEFGEAGTSAEVMELVWREHWDLVLLDISMPGRNGLEALREIRAARHDLPVLVQSIYAETQFAVRALRAGAAGYITKDSIGDALIAAVQKILHGGKYVTPTAAEMLATALADEGRAPHELLSHREDQVMRMLASGKSLKDIGSELSLSVKTISTYRQRVLEKMRIESNAELVRYVVQTGLME